MRVTAKHEKQTTDEPPAVAGVFERGRTRRLKTALRRRRGDDDGASCRGGSPNAHLSRRPVGEASSAIEALVTNPSTASELPMHQIPALVAELASEQATLSALQGVLTARLLASQGNAATSAESTDHLLT